MKTTKLLKYIYAVFMASVAISCTEEPYEAGEPEVDGCYAVYFPEQENTGDVEILPTDAKSFTFKAVRETENDQITVPVVVSASVNGESVSDIFTVGDIVFEDGQTETEFKVSFPDIELGQTYSCTITIEDPQYALTYGQYSTELAFNVIAVQWNLLGTGKYRDNLIDALLVTAVANPEKDVKIYERDDVPGYYRIDNVYDGAYMALMIAGDASQASGFAGYCYDASIFIDATDPSKVWIPEGPMGLNLPAESGVDFGDMSLRSEVAENGVVSGAAYGTLADGIITFPQNGVSVLAPGADGPGDWYPCNAGGLMRIILPGYRAYDYSVSLQSGEANNGRLPVLFTLGADITKVEYSVFEGRLSDLEIAEQAAALQNGQIPENEVGEMTESGIAYLTCPSTGIYTLVTANYSGDQYQGYNSISFSYLAAGESMPIKLTSGLIVSDKYANEGYTSENSMEFYAYGENISTAYIDIWKDSDYSGMTPGEVATVIMSESDPLEPEALDELNTTGYGGIFGNLSPGTPYTMFIVASNGYQTEIFMSQATTGGTPSPLYDSYSLNDLLLEQPATAEGYFGSYNYYAINDFAEPAQTVRTYTGQVTIEDSETPDETGMDYVSISGLVPDYALVGMKTDKMDFIYSGGYLFSTTTEYEPFTYSDMTFYPATRYLNTNGYIFSGTALIIGGFVHDGYIAFVDGDIDETEAGVPEGEFMGVGIYATIDQAHQGQGLWVGRYSNLLLVDPDVDENADAASAPAGKLNHIGAVLKDCRFRNYVELPESQMARAISETIAKVNHRNCNIVVLKDLSTRSVEFSVEYGPADSFIPAETDGGFVRKSL